MNCPVDQTTLIMSDRHGIEIDYCPRCRGVWLDRGELDKIIDRAATDQPRADHHARDDHHDNRYEDRNYDNRRYDDHRDSDSRHHKKSKREGFLGDIFDFGD